MKKWLMSLFLVINVTFVFPCSSPNFESIDSIIYQSDIILKGKIIDIQPVKLKEIDGVVYDFIISPERKLEIIDRKVKKQPDSFIYYQFED